MPNVTRNFLTISDISEETWIEIAATFTQREATFLTKFVPDGALGFESACEHWGTKCDVYEVQEDFSRQAPSSIFSAHFDTANGTLNKSCLEILSRRFSGATIVNICVCEMWEYAEIHVAKHGITMGYSCSENELVSLKKSSHEGVPDLKLPVDPENFSMECFKADFAQWLHNYREPYRRAQQYLLARAQVLQQEMEDTRVLEIQPSKKMNTAF
jgi:hypothetical protein